MADLRTAGRQVFGRLRSGAWSAGQCGIAAGGAWAFSLHVLGHPRPFFASVAAVVALGLRAGQRLRRTAELAVGVALGVAIGDLLVGLIGSGAWQIGVVVSVALLLSVAVGGSGLVVTQAGLQAVFVVALPRTPNSGFHRWQDALVGGAAALLVAAALPSGPWREARRLRAAYVTELASVLREAAGALRSDSAPRVADALNRARQLDALLERWQESLATGYETTRLSPLLSARGEFFPDANALTVGLSRATRNLRVLLRRIVAAIQDGQQLPACLADLLEQTAAALDLTTDGDAAVESLLALAGQLDPVALDAMSLSAQVVVGQLRVATVDLLEGLGIAHDRARNALPELA